MSVAGMKKVVESMSTVEMDEHGGDSEGGGDERGRDNEGGGDEHGGDNEGAGDDERGQDG